MACYDCEDCMLHEDKGGKCTKFEYNCPYDIFKGYAKEYPSDDDINQLFTLIKTIKDATFKMDEIVDRAGLYSDTFDSFKCSFNYLCEDLNEDSYKEWLKIKGD